MSFVLSTNDDDDFVVTKTLFMHSLELVILCVSYNPQQTIAILDRHDWTQQFFAQWFKALPSYSRVHDKKIILWAICALFDWLNGVGAGSPLSANVAQLLQGAIEVFRTYPDALAERKVAEANRDLEEEEVDDDMSDEEDLDLGEDDGDCAYYPLTMHSCVGCMTTDRLRPDSRGGRRAGSEHRLPGSAGSVRGAQLSGICQPMLTQSLTSVPEIAEQANRLARAGAFDDGDSAWSDEILWASPLDQFDSYQRFSGLLAGACLTLSSKSSAGLTDMRFSWRAQLAGLQTANPTLYQQSLAGLSAEQQTILADVATKAAEGGDQVVAAQAYAALQASEGAE